MQEFITILRSIAGRAGDLTSPQIL